VCYVLFHYIYTGELLDFKFGLVLGSYSSKILGRVQGFTLPKGYIFLLITILFHGMLLLNICIGRIVIHGVLNSMIGEV
jgi:uncharacterized membrane protein